MERVGGFYKRIYGHYPAAYLGKKNTTQVY